VETNIIHTCRSKGKEEAEEPRKVQEARALLLSAELSFAHELLRCCYHRHYSSMLAVCPFPCVSKTAISPTGSVIGSIFFWFYWHSQLIGIVSAHVLASGPIVASEDKTKCWFCTKKSGTQQAYVAV
jgi:hypothetical protein